MRKNKKHIIVRLTGIVVASILLFTNVNDTMAIGKLIFTNDIFINDANIFQIGGDKNAATDTLTLQFGGTNTKTLSWDTSKFNISNDTSITGGITATGQINFGAASGFRMREVASIASASCATVNELALDTTVNQIYKCTVTGSPGTWVSTGGTSSLQGSYNGGSSITTSSSTPITFTLSSGGFNVTGAGATSIGDNAGTVSIDSTSWDISSAGAASGLTGLTSSGTVSFTGGMSASGGVVNLNNNSNNAVNIGTGTSTGAVSVGGGSNTVAIDSSDWDISATGAMTGISGITNDSTLTTSGGAVNVNASSNFATNINTGTSTGAVSVGGGSNTVAIDSTSWDVSSAGVASGFTGVTSTGTVNFSGASSLAIPQSAGTPATCTVGDLVYNTSDNKVYTCTATNTWTISGPADFENVYAYDTDKTLTTSNGAFTIAAGSGAVNVNSTNASGITLNGNVNGPVNIGTGTSTGTVTLGGTGTQTIAVGNGAGVKTVNLGSTNTTSTTTISSGSGAVNINAGNNQPTNIGTGTSTGTVTIGGTGAQTIDIGDGAGAKTVGLGSTNTTSTTTINSGSGGLLLNASNSQSTFINTGTSTGAVNVGTGASTQTIALGTGAGAKTVNLGSTNTTSTTTINSGSGAVNINASNNQPTNINSGTSTGAMTFGNSLAGALNMTSGSAFTLTGGAASSINTTAGNITLQAAGTGATANTQIGAGGAGSTTPDYLALDVKSTTGDPAGGAEGYIYYNTSDNKFRCFENAAWRDCTGNPTVSAVTDTTITSPTPGTYPTYGTEIEILTPTNPSITPDNTSQRVLITGAVQYTNPTGGDDTNASIRVRIRRGSGNCAGTQVGPDLTATVSDPVQNIWVPFTLVDSPATASAQAYTVCAALADGNGATATNATTPTVMISVQEIAP